MSLRIALVIDGDQTGAKKALEDTATAIGKVDEAAGKAGEPIKKIGENLKDVATEAGHAKTGVEDIGGGATDTGTKFDGLALGAANAFKGIAAGIVGPVSKRLCRRVWRGFRLRDRYCFSRPLGPARSPSLSAINRYLIAHTTVAQRTFKITSKPD